MKCDNCGYKAQQVPPGIHYIEHFFYNNCSCGDKSVVCGKCITIKGLLCKTCKRDVKIEKILCG